MQTASEDLMGTKHTVAERVKPLVVFVLGGPGSQETED